MAFYETGWTKEKPYNEFYQNMPKTFFISKINKMEQHNITPKWNFSSLIDLSAIFTQIAQNFLDTQK